jgi:glutamate-5-semialdehyde dehydrogenase
MAERAREASRSLAASSGEARAAAIAGMADALTACRNELAEANAADMAEARTAGLAAPLLKRLAVDDKVFRSLQTRVLEVAALPDPIGRILEGSVRPTGLRVERVSVPIGVIAIIYESRPNVTTDAACVCLKSGNAVILRGGSESLRTNLVLAEAMRRAVAAAGLPENSVQIVPIADRELVSELLQQDRFIDVLIPRGGRSLIERVARESRIPVIKHYDGICHQYVAADADPDTAVAVVVNSKCQRVEVCNALETLLVDAACAPQLLPLLHRALSERGVVLRGCERTRALLPGLEPATDEDWSTEYLAPILSARGRRRGPGRGTHQPLRLRTHGRDRHPVDRHGGIVRSTRRFGLGPGQCLHAAVRRWRLRTGCRGGNQHRQTPRARPGRARAAHVLQMGGPR